MLNYKIIQDKKERRMERQWKYVPNTNNEYIVTEDEEVYSYKHEKLHKLSLSLCSQN